MIAILVVLVLAVTKGGLPGWILPVGPVAQYARLVELSNKERISWRNAFIFQMDEFLDWQGRPIPLDAPKVSLSHIMRTWVQLCAANRGMDDLGRGSPNDGSHVPRIIRAHSASSSAA
jgi:hypothetical protein